MLILGLVYLLLQPSHNPLSSSVWGNTGTSLAASWGPAANSANIWGAAPSKPPQQSYVDDDDEDDDDEDDDDDDSDDEGSFWDDAVKAASKSRQQQRQPQPLTHQRQHQQPRQIVLPAAVIAGYVRRTYQPEETVVLQFSKVTLCTLKAKFQVANLVSQNWSTFK